MEDVRIQELEDEDAHLLEASAAEVRDHAEPVLVAQLFLGHACEHVQQPLGDQPLQLAEWLRLEDRADVPLPVGVTLAEDQLADFPEQGRGLFPQLSLQFRPPLHRRQPRQLPARQLQEPVHLVIDVGTVRSGGRLLPGQELRDVGLGHLRGSRELALPQAEFLQPLPYQERHIQGDVLQDEPGVVNCQKLITIPPLWSINVLHLTSIVNSGNMHISKAHWLSPSSHRRIKEFDNVRTQRLDPSQAQ